ncbi:MAG: PTS transporter subunit EIIC, partial [Oscillospiraceae bacterium]
MLPIAILPVAGLFLGIGSSFTNETMLKAYGLYGIMGPGTIIHGILTVMSAAGSIVFDNLPLLFAIGVAIGMAKREKEVAALASVIAFFIMHTAISALISVNYAGGDMSMDAMEQAVVNLEQNLGLSGATSMVLGIYTLNMG